MNRFRITPSVIPNLFTSMNMFCGFLSIINSSSGNYIYASWLIVIAAIFDTLDGFMARLTKSSSQLGVELDSLSDLVSFGTAPSFLIYSIFLHEYNSIGVMISSLLMIAGGFRLARFNVQLVGFNKTFFTGLPIPASAITVAGFIIAFYIPGFNTQGIHTPGSFLPQVIPFIIPLVLALSYLMVSKIKYDTFPKLSKIEIRRKPYLLLFPIFIIAAFIFIPIKRILFLTFVLIILFGIFRHIYSLINKKK